MPRPEVPSQYATGLQAAVAFVTSLVLAIAATWPLAGSLNRAFALGTERFATVPLASSWALWWTNSRIHHGLAGLWDAPIFFPRSGSFALSEPITALGGLATPLLSAGLEPVTAHNLLLLLCLALNGLCAWRLLRRLCETSAAPWLGMLMAVLLPFVFHELGVLTLVPVFTLLLSLEATLVFLETPSTARGAWLGASLALTGLTCAHYLLFFVLCAPLLLALLVGRRHLSRPVGRGALAAVLVCGLVLAPQALAQHSALSAGDFARSAAHAKSGSATWSNWFTTQWPAVIGLPEAVIPVETRNRGLFPGAVKIGLAAMALFVGFRRRDRRLIGIAALGAAALAWSVLPRLELLGWSPYTMLSSLVPPLEQVRSPYRFAVLVHLVLVILAALGLDALLRSARRRYQALAVALGLCACIELWPGPSTLAQAPSPGRYGAYLEAIAEHIGAQEALAHVPSAGGSLRKEQAATWMYLQASHGRPLAGGYSSYFPPQRESLYRETRGFPDSRSTAFFDRLGVRWVMAARPARPGSSPADSWEPVWRSEDLQLALYRRR